MPMTYQGALPKIPNRRENGGPVDPGNCPAVVQHCQQCQVPTQQLKPWHRAPIPWTRIKVRERFLYMVSATFVFYKPKDPEASAQLLDARVQVQYGYCTE